MTDITTTLTYTADLTRPLRRMNIPALFITDARRAHRITVTVLRTGNPVDLGDTAVSGTVKHLRTGTTIPLSGIAHGSIASVTLPPAAYAQPGDIEIYVTLTSGDVQNCIFAATGCVFPSSTDRVADVPGFYSLAALQEQFSSLDVRLRALEEIGIPVTTADQLVSAVPLDSWKFNLISTTANTAYSSTAEAAAGFDDASWRTVSVPHDWSVELDFNASSPATYEGGYLDGGDAWYRTTVSVNKQSGRRYVLCFDGVYMESTVYVNGQQVHKNYYGYNPFAVDATEQMVSGVNTIAVFVRNEQPSSRLYSGSGMIRPVELVTLLDDQIRMENIRVTTPKLDSDLTNGETVVAFDAVNKTGAEASATFTVDLYDPDGAKVGTADASAMIAAGETQNVSATVALANPTLWAIGAGKLYEAQISAKVGNRVQRSKRVTYGYRSIRFDKDTGFYLNGIHTKLKGVCVHHDGGCIGAAENRSAIERQVDILTNMGCNAIRLTHNPFGAEYLDVCQRKGVLLVEELFDCWTKSKKQKDFGRYFTDHYAEVVTSAIHRDWNNPAVIMWSLGNEVRTNLTLGDYSSSEIVNVCTMVNSAVKALDSTRPTTMGNNAPGGNLSALMAIVDVVGINYNGNNQTYQTDRPIYGSETTSALSSRGVYALDSANMAYPSYDNKAVSWGNTAAETVNAYLSSARSCGHFVWTGFDYLGEPTEWNKYPAKSSYFGIVDTCGFPKDIYFMYQSMWDSRPMVHILPHWTHESGNIDVWLYSNCASVELFLNGTSLGKKTLSQRGTKNQYAYTVAYAAGTLVANGYDASGNLIAQDIQYTAGTPAKLALSSDKTAVAVASDDLVYITCDVQDKNGTLCPNADNSVVFTVVGGTIIGTDNGHGANVEKLSGSRHSAFSGKCLCVVKHDGASGAMKITATANGLTAGTISVTKGETTIAATAPAASFVDATNPPMRDTTVPPAPLPVLYELPQETVFTAGADGIIDTGVRLFQDVSTKPAYTILFDVTCSQNLTPNPSAGETCVLFHCLEESSPWPGLVGHAAGTDVSFQINMYSSSKTITPFCKGKRIRCALVLDGENWYFASDRYPTETDYNKPSLIGGYKTAVAKSLLLGGYQKSDGTHGRFFDGTLHSFKVLRGAYTMAECQEWVNGTEE